MTILALDQSTKLTGWAEYKDNQCVQYGAIDLSRNADAAGRFTAMCEAVVDLIQEVQPGFLVMEGTAFQRNAAAFMELAQLQGVIIGACLRYQIEFYIYPPSSWRKELGFAQGKGTKRADLKKQAVAYAKELLGHEEPEDVSEAICIGAAFQHFIHKEKLNG